MGFTGRFLYAQSDQKWNGLVRCYRMQGMCCSLALHSYPRGHVLSGLTLHSPPGHQAFNRQTDEGGMRMHVHAHISLCMCHDTHVLRSEDCIRKLVPSFHHVGSENQTQVIICKQCILLTSEPSFQPPKDLFLIICMRVHVYECSYQQRPGPLDSLRAGVRDSCQRPCMSTGNLT